MDLISKREAAGLLGVSTRAVERAVRRGHLTVHYRDSKHGKKAWFAQPDVARYKEHQETRGPVGFMSGPSVGTVIPMVEMKPRQGPAEKEKAGEPFAPISERLMLKLDEVAALSGLPRSFLSRSVQTGALKAVRIGRILYVKRSDLNEFVRAL